MLTRSLWNLLRLRLERKYIINVYNIKNNLGGVYFDLIKMLESNAYSDNDEVQKLLWWFLTIRRRLYNLEVYEITFTLFLFQGKDEERLQIIRSRNNGGFYLWQWCFIRLPCVCLFLESPFINDFVIVFRQNIPIVR